MRTPKKEIKPGTTNATRRVLGTYELLEHILFNLDPPDLRKKRFVSKAWHEVITRSQILNATWKWNVKTIRQMRMLLLGDAGAGKRSLIERWILGFYLDTHAPWTNDSYRKLTSIDQDHKKWVFDIYYLSREDQFPPHLPMCIRDSDCYALVYSSISRETFDSMRDWHNTIQAIGKDFLSTPHPSRRVERSMLLALVATACDVPDSERQVSVDEGVKLATELGCPFYETSAKTALNIDVVFESMGRTCRDAMRLYSTAEPPPLEELRKATKGRLRSNVHQRFASVRRKLGGTRSELR